MKNFIRTQNIPLTHYLNRAMPKPSKSYPCLCEISKHVLLLARISGILPIKPVQGKDIRSCSFQTPSYHIAYSVFLQIAYCSYFCLVYSVHWYCSQDKSYTDTNWYLMTVGYLIADLDSMVTLLLGLVRSKRVCKILERLSKLDSCIATDRKLKTNVTHMTWFIVLYLGIQIFIFLHSSIFLSTSNSGLFVMNCSSLESTFAVLIRGFTVIFPTIEIPVMYMFVVLIEYKFEYLADSVALTIENITSVNGRESFGIIHIKTIVKGEEQTKKENKLEKPLDRLADMHLEIFNIANEINYCFGPQLLIGNCSSLYTMIYYLYRYITFTMDGEHRTRSTKIYYVLSFIYRLTKVIGYMILGQRFHNKSLLPLRTIQKARITNLPSHFQLQLQTLMLQWSDKKAYLSACGIVNFGLWLLAPIAGNIITYLLVALQFDDIAPLDSNSTLLEESML